MQQRRRTLSSRSPAHARPRTSARTRLGAASAGTLVLAGLGIPTANAAVVTTILANYDPGSTTVGQPVALEVSIYNNNTAPNETEDSVISNIVLTPSCGGADANGCAAGEVDPGVLDVTGATGADACLGITFTPGAPAPGTGAVTLTPLAPAMNPIIPPLAKCTINVAATVLKLPTQDADAGGDLQTLAVITAGTSTSSQNAALPVVGTSNPLTIGKAVPVMHTFTSSGGGPLGTKVRDNAFVTGRFSPTAGGNLRFNLYGPQVGAPDCSNDLLVYSSGLVPQPIANGPVLSPAFAPTAVGTYYWTADYTGDANNVAVTDDCGDATETVVITPGVPNPDPVPDPDPDPDPDPALTCNGKAVTIPGTPGNDNINGTDGDDVITGLGGNDNINGRGGDDTICGGPGNDNINGGSGHDYIDGGPGNDNINHGSGG